MFRTILYIFIISIFIGCTTKEEFVLFNKADLNQSKRAIDNMEFKNVKFEYKIVPHDRVSLIVYQHPEFSISTLGNGTSDRGILVDSKGNIRLPLVKSIHIAGLTQTEAQEKIENAFMRYIKSPDIYFEVLNKRAYVVGEVNRPGEIKLDNEQLSLIQIIAKAGDLTDSANRRAIMILKSGEDRVNSQIVDLTDFNSLKNANLMIRPNDIVYVLPNSMKPFNIGIEEVNPIFRLIGNTLSPFLTIKLLKDWSK